MRRVIACRHHACRDGGQNRKARIADLLAGMRFEPWQVAGFCPPPGLRRGARVKRYRKERERRVSDAGVSLPLLYSKPTGARPQRTISMATINGNIALSDVTDKEMELIGHSRPTRDQIAVQPQVIQLNNKPNGTTYNNVTFTYFDLHSFNVVAEIVNDLHKQESKAA